MTEKKEPTTKVDRKFTITYEIKPLSLGEKAKAVGRFLVIFAVSAFSVAAIFYATLQFTQVFPEFILVKAGNELLNIMIQADGILLGFSGIIFAQLFSSVNDQQTVLYQRIIEKKTEETIGVGKLLNYLERKKVVLTYSMLFSFLFLIFSIFGSMARIAYIAPYQPTDTYSSLAIFFVPVLFTMVAVVLLTFALTGLSLKPPLEEEKSEKA